MSFDPRSHETRLLADLVRAQSSGSRVASRGLFWAKVAGITGIIGVIIGLAALAVAIIK